jgi:hypothetical protein
MSLEYIRDYYKVPADLGRRIQYTGNKGSTLNGVITGADDAHLLARLDSYEEPVALHPTWNVEYLDDIEEADS